MSADDGERVPDEIKAAYFAIVPEWILDEAGDVVKLYALLDRKANNQRRVWPGQADLAEKLRCSERQVRRYLTRLRDLGALETVKRRYNGTTIYVLHKDPPGHGSTDRPDTRVLTDRTGESTLSGHGCPPKQSHSLRTTETESLTTVSAPQTEADPVVAVFDAWKASTGRTNATVLDAKRTRLITAALKSHSVPDVLDAVKGWEHSPFHRGENPERKKWNDLGLLLRDAENIEKFRDLARGPRLTSGLARSNGSSYRPPIIDQDQGGSARRITTEEL